VESGRHVRIRNRWANAYQTDASRLCDRSLRPHVVDRKVSRLAREKNEIAAPKPDDMKRPFQIVVIGCLLIAGGLATVIGHVFASPFDSWTFPLLLVGILGMLGGIFLIRGHSWARWLVLAWLAFHVAVSALNSISNSLAHLVLSIAVGYFLLVPPTSKFFSSTPVS
jgi:hypothetical protein